MDLAPWEQTVEIAMEGEVISRRPHEGAFRTDLAIKALEGIKGDIKGFIWTKAVVQVTPGGE